MQQVLSGAHKTVTYWLEITPKVHDRCRISEIKKNLELWVGCVAGALSDYEYVAKLAKAGFDNIDIDPTRVYSIEDWMPHWTFRR